MTSPTSEVRSVIIIKVRCPVWRLDDGRRRCIPLAPLCLMTGAVCTCFSDLLLAMTLWQGVGGDGHVTDNEGNEKDSRNERTYTDTHTGNAHTSEPFR